MLPRLQRAFERLERSRVKLLAPVTGWTPDQMQYRPAPNSWSAAQVIDHIARVESGLLAEARKNAKGPVPTREERFGNRVIFLVMWLPLRIKVPDTASMVLPAKVCSSEEALHKWQHARDAWQSFLEGLKPSDLKPGVFAHPRAGRMTVPDVLTFLRLHHNHHRPQLARIASGLRHQN